MVKCARDLMTPDPACCSPATPLDQVAKMMVQNDCGEIPIIDASNRPVGVVTDRDIVCRAVAEGKNPAGYPAENVMTHSVVTVSSSATLEEVLDRMRDHQLRRMPVVDDDGCLVGIIAQADIATEAAPRQAADLVREVSRDTGQPSR
ncbi:MAG TPA: CBS domain-containing protein [Vicinamibacterales bacterium]|nr:CBS domain-containing protein [Vicinamibacterales bacterium]